MLGVMRAAFSHHLILNKDLDISNRVRGLFNIIMIQGP